MRWMRALDSRLVGGHLKWLLMMHLGSYKPVWEADISHLLWLLMVDAVNGLAS